MREGEVLDRALPRGTLERTEEGPLAPRGTASRAG